MVMKNLNLFCRIRNELTYRGHYTMYKWAMVALIIVASIMGVFYSFEAVNEAKKEQADEVVGENELRFIAEDFAFDQEEYTVEAGQTLELSLRNKNGLHGLGIEELGIDLVEGEPIEYTFDTPGTYEIVCTISCGIGHAEMRSTLIVTEASAAPAPEESETEAAH